MLALFVKKWQLHKKLADSTPSKATAVVIQAILAGVRIVLTD